MKVALAILVVAICSVSCDVITPPDCSSGGGSATDVTVEVTGLSGSPPYTMSTGTTYTVTFTFTPTQDAPAGTFAVSAEPIVLGETIPLKIPQASVQTEAFVQGQSTTVSLNFSISPLLDGQNAAFFGIVNDGNRNTVVCKTGDVNISSS